MGAGRGREVKADLTLRCNCKGLRLRRGSHAAAPRLRLHQNPAGGRVVQEGLTRLKSQAGKKPRKIGRQSSSGCIGLYNEQIKQLFDWVKVGTQVKLI